jgi:predicted transcriptional regulator
VIKSPKSPIETVNETVNGAFETVNVPRETVKVENETVNETVKSKNETVKVSSETVKNLIERYPGITGKRLVEFVGKSRATVMRFIAALKAKGHIEYRGSAKTGGYFIPEKVAHNQAENGILAVMTKSTRNVLALMFAIYGGTCAYAASDGAAHSCPIPPPQSKQAA